MGFNSVFKGLTL